MRYDIFNKVITKKMYELTIMEVKHQNSSSNFLKILLVLFVITLIQRTDSKIVNTEQGAIEGKTLTTERGFKYDSYQGIPYAQPPVGELRFKDPIPRESWSGTLDATALRNSCVQYDILVLKTFYGAEDCLFVNVYVPQSDSPSTDFPVMVWIHGGAYLIGDPTPMLYGPGRFVEQNVILVTIAYRLGVMGFLSLDTPDVPGNAGLKDQSLALKWVKKNIQSFGGNPDRITIFGESAGAASVQSHILSPMSKGLFASGIMMSGSALCPWSLQRDPMSAIEDVAQIFEIDSSDLNSVGQFLRTVPAEDLVLKTLPDAKGFKFYPIVEKSFPGVTPFFTRSPKEVLTLGEFDKVPVIIGMTPQEGYILPLSQEQIAVAKENRIPELKYYVPQESFVKFGDDAASVVVKKIEDFFFSTSDDVLSSMYRLSGDFLFVKDIMKSVEQFSFHNCPTFFCEFSYDGSTNLYRFMTDLKYTGAVHGDELSYMFESDFKDLKYIPLTEDDKRVSKWLVELWTNFAKFGNPTPSDTPISWKQVESGVDDFTTLDIDKELTLIKNPFAEQYNFWKDIME